MSHSRWIPSSRSMDYKSPLPTSLIRAPRRSWLPMILVAVAASALTLVLTSGPLAPLDRDAHHCHSTVGPIVLRQHDVQSRLPLRSRPAELRGKEGSSKMDVEYSRLNPLEEIEQYVARLPPSSGQTASTSSREHHPAVKGAPTPEFRQNLVVDRKYITTFHDAGWTNQIMMIANMIYLGLHTQHTPILPPFMAMHVGLSEGSIAFSEIFDLPLLEKKMGIDILDWTQVKEFPIGTRERVAKQAGARVEDIGCWSSWAPVAEAAGATHRESDVPYLLGLDISYTPVPKSVTTGQWNHLSQWSLAALGYPGGRAEALRETSSLTTPSPNGLVSLPDEQLMCFDFLYYVSIKDAWDWQREWAPQWNIVLRHLHWTPKMDAIATEALSHLLDLDPHTKRIPTYIAIHARHGDFKNQCPPGTSPEDCFPPLSDIEDAVDRVQTMLKEQKGIEIDPRNVLVASDEKSDVWWGEVKEHGWKRIDHSEGVLDTGRKYGKWYEVFIDAAIMSKAKGFVGTMGSTMSELAVRRVQDWEGGIAVMVHRPGA